MEDGVVVVLTLGGVWLESISVGGRRESRRNLWPRY